MHPGRLTDAQWSKTFLVNVTGNYLLAQQTEWIFQDQQLPAAMVLTGSANAVVSKKGSEAYDTSKSAVNHLIRELAIGLAPLVRVNGIAPATVVSGSTMFPRDRVMQSLQKYNIAFAETESTEELRGQARGVLCAAHADAPPDSSARLRERHRLAVERRQRQDHRPHHSRRRRTDGSVSPLKRAGDKRGKGQGGRGRGGSEPVT